LADAVISPVQPKFERPRRALPWEDVQRLLRAVGIQRALVYHGVNMAETYEAVGVAVERIADNIQERLAHMRQRCTA
jgi:alkylation response protein AidB-like acyl-CoA dehydrogenase